MEAQEGNKNLLVADFVHRSIPISEIEKRVISTEVFNRLHNVLQNSTLYLTYPSSRTSRFSHSLGCTHIAGKIFLHSILNANEHDRNSLLDEVTGEIKSIEKPDRNDSLYYLFDNLKARPDYTPDDCLEKMLQVALYRSVVPGILSGNHQYAFLIAFQAVRLAGLLHDIGHPPFSHVTEKALTEINNYIISKPSPNEFQEDFAQKMEKSHILEGDRDPHEELGIDLARVIIRDLFKSPGTIGSYNVWLISQITMRILTDHIGIYQALHHIIASQFDADKLDYVPRDLGMSGIGSGTPNYDRLYTSFRLVYHKQENNPSRFKFLPSIRSLQVIEEFYRDYQQLYKYVIYHHRVAKTDGLLRQVIYELAKNELETPSEQNKPSTYRLPPNISGLWEILFFKSTAAAALPAATREKADDDYAEWLKNQYMQWDDAWLLSVLRKHYFIIRDNYKEGDEIKPLQAQLTELLANRKHYYSLYKRLDTFKDVDDAFWKALEEAVTSGRKIHDELIIRFVDPTARIILEPVLSLVAWYESFPDHNTFERERYTDQQYVKLRQEVNVFLSLIIEAVLVQKGKLSFIEEALAKLCDNSQLDHAFYEPKRPKQGIKSSFTLYSEDSIVRIGEISGIDIELHRSRYIFPPFYVFVFRNKGIPNSELITMRRNFGMLIWEAFDVWLTGAKVKE